MTDYEISLAFSLFPGIGPSRFTNLVKIAGSLQSAWETASEDLYKQAEISKNTYIDFEAFKNEYDPEKYSKEFRRHGIFFLNQSHESYPKQLLKIPNPPIGIFGKGNLKVLKSDQTIAVVGSRKMSSYGRSVTEKVVSELCNFGNIIVSGLALGIDGAAHKACLDAGGLTVAVLGNGVESCYPKENEFLYKRILENNGLIVSEYPPGATPTKGSFLSRNRIIAAISNLVIVPEAGKRSGSLVTAEYANKYGKAVFAVPGTIYSSLSQGTHHLIKNGAQLLTSTEDLGFVNGSSETKLNLQNLTEVEKQIYTLLTKESYTIDEISKKCVIPIAELSQVLTELEIAGYIVTNGEGEYTIKQS